MSNKSSMARALKAQRNEITEYFIYSKLARILPEGRNREVMEHLAQDEKRHYGIWRKVTGQDVNPVQWKIWLYFLMARVLGLSFGLRLMERGETLAQGMYGELRKDFPQAAELVKDEQRHEEELLGMIDERLLAYVGSIVLGLSDAIVELTGALAGLTLALQETKLIAMVGFITGFAASLSMGASEYLSTKEDGGNGKHPLRAGLVTGVTYLVTVLILISVYFVFDDAFVALGMALLLAVIIISVFTFYISVVKKSSFKKRLGEMVAISLAVAGINFVIGLLVKQYFNI